MSNNRIIIAITDMIRAIKCKCKLKCCNSECSTEPNNAYNESDRLGRHTNNRRVGGSVIPSV